MGKVIVVSNQKSGIVKTSISMDFAPYEAVIRNEEDIDVVSSNK